MAVASMLTACSAEAAPPVSQSVLAPMTSQTPSVTPVDPRVLPEDPLSPKQERVREEERVAARVMYEQFHGTSIDGLAPVEVVIAARLSCTMMDPTDKGLYKPEALEISMRDTYTWHRDEREMRIFSAMLAHFCPELHPGDQVIDELILDVTSG